MKRTLFLFILLFMAVDMTYAQAQKTVDGEVTLRCRTDDE